MKQDRLVGRHAAIPVDRWLEELERNVPVARKGLDPEGVHQMRVAMERLRVWSKLAGKEELGDELRWIRRRLAVARDLDVRLEDRPPAEIIAALRLQRARAQRDLRATLESRRFDDALTALRRLPPAPAADARRAIPDLARKVVVQAKKARRHEDDLDSLHAVRRAVRRLRFALEWLRVDASKLADLQDALGAACDAHIRLRALRKSHGARSYRERLRRRRRKATNDAVAALRHVRRRVDALVAAAVEDDRSATRRR
jgi:CHAD domain-containing protein